MNTTSKSTVSIVVPLYQGKQYILKLLEMIEECQKKANQLAKIELILSNDEPNEKIGTFFSGTIDIHVLNTDQNRGIQGARIRGLEAGTGEYVVFLDQDDILYPDYICNQIEEMKEADAVVCRCIHEGRQFYNESMIFENVIHKEYMLTKGNPIISTGQVMLRRAAIPEVWLNCVMKSNCADDYLLWLCMIAKNAKIVLNQRILFEHTVNGKNLSLDVRRMKLSLDEMYEILAKNKVFDEQELRLISSMRENVLFEQTGLLEKFREMFFVLNKIMEYREAGWPIGKRLKAAGIQCVAIYGDGYIGKRLMGELRQSDIETLFFIDRNAEYLTEEVPVYQLGEAPENVDAVIVSLVRGSDLVKTNLQEKYRNRVYTVKEIMEEI